MSWRIVFMGTPDFAVPSLEALLAGPDPVVGVVTQPDKVSGRGSKLIPPPVKVVAEGAGLPVLQPTRLRAPEAVAQLRELAPDLVVVAAFGQILSREVLELPPHGCINVHGSLLPRWRGAAPVQRALMAGDELTGITIMRMDEGLDTGDILTHRQWPITPEVTGGELHDAMARLGAELLLETIAGLRAGEVVRTVQPLEGVTYAHKLTREDCPVDWGRTAREVRCQIHALNPVPGATTVLEGQELKVWRGRESDGYGAAGEVIALHADGFEVACGSGSVVLTEVQAPGKRRMSAEEWMRGRRLATGVRFR